jgi:hypothetical protein
MNADKKALKKFLNSLNLQLQRAILSQSSMFAVFSILTLFIIIRIFETVFCFFYSLIFSSFVFPFQESEICYLLLFPSFLQLSFSSSSDPIILYLFHLLPLHIITILCMILFLNSIIIIILFTFNFIPVNFKTCDSVECILLY